MSWPANTARVIKEKYFNYNSVFGYVLKVVNKVAQNLACYVLSVSFFERCDFLFPD
ncbi:hypothetical protein LguiA_011575 [Lonicera macranthoides]